MPVEPLAGKVVIDTNNYYPQRDGQIAALDDGSTTSAALLQEHLPQSHVVKAFNHITSAHLTEHGPAGRDRGPPGTRDRRRRRRPRRPPSPRSSTSSASTSWTSGPLAESWRIEPGTPGYGPRLDAAGMREALAAATRG